MKFYLAAKYERQAEIKDYRDLIIAEGHQVTSRWLDQKADPLTPEDFRRDHILYSRAAYADLDDIKAADVVISFTDDEGGGRGGRHFETGYAFAADKGLIVVGPREHLFHCLLSVVWYPAWNSFISELRLGHLTR